MASINFKNGRWHVRVRVKAHPTVCGSFLRRADAAAWGKATEADVLAGRYSSKVSERTPSPITVGELLQRYADTVSITKRGAREEKNVVALMERSQEFQALWKKGAGEARATDFAILRDRWLASGLAAATVRNRFSLFSSAFTCARREWGLEDLRNPLSDVTRPAARNERARRLVGDELDRIIAAATHVELPSLLVLLVETAMRRSEAIGLTWDRVHLTERYVHLATTKNRTSRNVPLSPRAIDALSGVPRTGDRVFTMTPNAASLAFRRAVARARERYVDECARAGRDVDKTFLFDLRLHDQRREAASRMIESGVFNVMEAASVTGHRRLDVLHQRYSVLLLPRLADKLAEADALRARAATLTNQTKE